MSELAGRIREFVGRWEWEGDWSAQASARLLADCAALHPLIDAYVDTEGQVDWDRLAWDVDDSGWSSGSKAIVRFACSLAGKTPVIPDARWALSEMAYPYSPDGGLLLVEAIRYATQGPQ